MNKIIVVVLLSILLTGCVLLPPTKQGLSIPQTHTGTQGAEVTFVDNAPPFEVFENQLVEISFGIENKGAVDIQNGVYILGLPEEFETQDDVFGRFSLKGKSLFNPFGDARFYVVKARARELGAQLERVPSSVSVDVCYPYRSEVSAFVCINPELGAVTKPTKVCTPAAQSFSGQGAPVAVTSIDAPQILLHENPALIKPQIAVHVRNVGRGIVVAKQKFADACTQRAMKDAYGVINIGGTLSDIPLDCTPAQARLSLDDTVIVCTLNAGLEKARGSHTALLNLNIDYGYLTKKTRPITVKRSLQ